MKIKDSGERREFTTGAVRDVSGGKGRCDLLPLDIIGKLTNDPILENLNNYIRTGEFSCIEKVMAIFIDDMFGDYNTALLEISKHYEAGAEKYAERNWEKGIPLHCYIDSGVRHYLKFMRGDTDEPHDKAFLWNMLGLLWTHENMPEMNDLPFAEVTE